MHTEKDTRHETQMARHRKTKKEQETTIDNKRKTDNGKGQTK